MSLTLKYSQKKWVLMELLIISYLSVHYFEGIICRIWNIVLALWLVYFFVDTIQRGLRYQKKYLYPVLIIAFLTVITSLYNTKYADNSFSMLFRVIEVAFYTLTIVLSINDREQLIHIWRPLFIGGVIAAIYQLIHIDYGSLSSSVASNVLRISLSDKIFVNTYAFQALLSLYAGFKYIFYLNQSAKSRKTKVALWLVGTALIFVGMLMTGSRKVIPAVICFFIIFFCYGKKNFWRIILIALAVYFGLNAVIRIPSLYNTIGWRIEMVLEESDDASSDERASLRQDAIMTGLSHPFGVGLDNSKYYSTTREVYAHNNYAEFFADFGIMGFMLYYGFYIYIIKKILREMKREQANLSFEKNFYLALIVSIMFIEYYQIVYYNFSYHVVLAALTLFTQYNSERRAGAVCLNAGEER